MASVFKTDKLEIQYLSTSKEARIDKITLLCKQDVVIIPEEINGVPVTTVKAKFIAKTDFEYNEVKLPSSLIYIKAEAFYCNKSIKRIVIPSSVVAIENSAFHGCKNLAEVIFEEGSHLEIVGENAFYDDKKLKELRFPDSLKRLGRNILGDVSNVPCYVPKLPDEEESYMAMYYIDDLYIPMDLEYIKLIEKNKRRPFSGVYGEKAIITIDNITYQIFDDFAVAKEIKAKENDEIIIPNFVEYKKEKFMVKGIAPDFLPTSYGKHMHFKKIVLPSNLEFICNNGLEYASVDEIIEIPYYKYNINPGIVSKQSGEFSFLSSGSSFFATG